MGDKYFLAIDIGASSGRHILGSVTDGKLSLEEVYRFPNGMKEEDGTLYWDVDSLFEEILTGMKKCKDLGKIPVSVGVDTWGVDFGFVGDVDRADGQMLSHLIQAGITPVMAPLTHDGQGHILNTNADTIASETAKALAPYYDVTLIYSFEKKGVLRNPDDDNSVIPTITRADFEQYKADGTISGGMLPKIENALSAVDAGVSKVIITLATAIDGESGTKIF
jgi:acetylglutamate kinase